MKERPILFSGPMVRAILDGRKTMTRRVVKDLIGDDETPALECGLYHPTVVDRHGEEEPGEETFGVYTKDGSWATKCSYGQPGDRLWVREALLFKNWGVENALLTYEADGATVTGVPVNAPTMTRPRRPAMLMPRWASRLTLEVTGVRVERLQDISDEDAKAEGVELTRRIGPDQDGRFYKLYRPTFIALWDSINAKRAPWASNPWVWCISFRRIG